MQPILFACHLARDNAGNNNAARMAIIAITTSNSINVNPRDGTLDLELRHILISILFIQSKYVLHFQLDRPKQART